MTHNCMWKAIMKPCAWKTHHTYKSTGKMISVLLSNSTRDRHFCSSVDFLWPTYLFSPRCRFFMNGLLWFFVSVLFYFMFDVFRFFPSLRKQNMSTDINKELYEACEDGHLREVKRLLAAGAGVNAAVGCDTPLTIASYRGHLEVVQILLDNGVDINLPNSSGYVKRCHFYLVSIQLPFVSQRAIHCAARNGHDSIVNLLALRGACADLKDYAGFVCEKD